MRRSIGKALRNLTVLLLVAPGAARALPTLQLYTEGGRYDSTTQTWMAKADENGFVRLWAIGDVQTDNRGNVVPILDVKLAVAYQHVATDPTIQIQGSKTGGYEGFTDESTPDGATQIGGVHHEGEVPQLSGTGGALPDHGVYNQPNVHWQEFALGDFDLLDSPLANFGDNLPTTPAEGPTPLPDPTRNMGQINVYTVRVTGVDPANPWVHFDLYDHVQSSTKGESAPFSHDGQGTGTPPGGGGGAVSAVPEPTTLILLGTGLLGLGGVVRKKKVQGVPEEGLKSVD